MRSKRIDARAGSCSAYVMALTVPTGIKILKWRPSLIMCHTKAFWIASYAHTKSAFIASLCHEPMDSVVALIIISCKGQGAGAAGANAPPPAGVIDDDINGSDAASSMEQEEKMEGWLKVVVTAPAPTLPPLLTVASKQLMEAGTILDNAAVE